MTAFVPLAGSRRTPMPNSRLAGSIDGSALATLTVRARSKSDPGELAKLAYTLAGQPVAQRQYLSLAQLEDQYGAASADLDAIEHYAHAHNLRVGRRSAVERMVTLKGRLTDLLAAFPADLRLYHHPVGAYRGRTGDILVPDGLSAIITGVSGFDTRPRRRTRHRRMLAAQTGPGGQNGVAATEFAKRYQFPPGDGTGQTIAIIELGGGYRASDLQVFFHEIGVPMPNVAAISVDAAVNDPTTDSAPSADGEVMLDIEVAGAVVPKANFLVYFAPNSGDQGFQDALSMAVHDPRRPGAVSISWGSPEDYTDAQGLAAYHEIFAAAGALGVTICAATGDHGTADDDAQHWDRKAHVNHPSSDDLVLACGGTQISKAGADVVWNDGTTLDEGGWATGGGISAFPPPAYQANAGVEVSMFTGQVGRGLPDIAMSATNYFTRTDTIEGASGGTSAVTPLMAALVTLLNQAKGGRVGLMQPFLYANAAQGLFVDVTSGTNAVKGTIKGYKARKGWDPCTGLGTPIGTAILAKLP